MKTNRGNVYYLGDLMKAAVDEYHKTNPYVVTKKRVYSNPENGPWFTCHNCGSGGLFKIELYGGDYDHDQIQLSLDKGYYDPNGSEKRYVYDAAKSFGKAITRGYNITITPNGTLNFDPEDSHEINVVELNDKLSEGADSHIGEHLTCANCGYSHYVAWEDPDNGIYIDDMDVEYFGNALMLGDQPTNWEYWTDKKGKFLLDRDDQKIRCNEKITREGLMDNCIDCYNHDDYFMDEWEKCITSDENANNDIDRSCGLCPDQCPHSRDFYLLGITPREIMNYKTGYLTEERQRPNLNQMTIGEINV